MRLCVLLLLAGVATGAESVIGVWNTASFDPFGYVAPGSLVRVQLKDAPLFFSFDPSDVSLQFQATGTDGPQHLRLTYISRSDWLEALIPYNAPLGPATLTLAFSGQTTAPFAIRVVESHFGLYTVNSGVAPAKATVNGQTLTLTNPLVRETK